MALPKLDKLIALCEERGHVFEGRPSKDDCVRVLREAHLPFGGLPYEEVTPMLCFPEWKLKPGEVEEVWSSEEWCAQEKLNGVRAVVHFVAYVGVFVHTRTTSVRTWRYQEITDQFVWDGWVPSFSAVIDCEALVDSPVDTSPWTGQKRGPTRSALASTVSLLHLEAHKAQALQMETGVRLRLHVFDVMRWGDEWIGGLPLWERYEYLNLVMGALGGLDVCSLFEFVPVYTEGKRGFMQDVVRGGGEGVILKNLFSVYEASSSRRRRGWVKVKRRMEFDAWVSGYRVGEEGTEWEGLVGSLEFSVYVEGGPHVIGYAAAMDMEERRSLTVHGPEGEVLLDSAVYGRVAEISGQDISSRELRLTHCRIERWREDKDEAGCVESLEDLERMAEWVK